MKFYNRQQSSMVEKKITAVVVRGGIKVIGWGTGGFLGFGNGLYLDLLWVA